jgi:hypothetical protein
MEATMRFLIEESFDRTEVNHYFEADIAVRIGGTLRTKAGKTYRVKDIAFFRDSLDRSQNVRVLLKRLS